MVYRKLQRVGNSWMISIPRDMCNKMQIYPGDYVKVKLSNLSILVQSIMMAEELEEYLDYLGKLEHRRRKDGPDKS